MIKKLLSEYLKYIGAQVGNERNKSILQLLSVDRKAKYLDLGCGDGRLTIDRAGKIGTDKIYGYDSIDNGINKSEKKGIFVQKGNLNEELPFKNKEFDIITATQVIEHLNNIDMFVSEVYRILKKGGIFILSTENLAAWHNIFALILGSQPSVGPWISERFFVGFHPLHKEYLKDCSEHNCMEKEDPHTRVMAYKSIKKLFKLYNFRIMEEKTLGYYPFPSIIANILSSLDRWHSVNIILKLQKE